MSIERLDVSRLLAADMRPLLDDAAMTHVLRDCGGVILGEGATWYIKIGGSRVRGPNRAVVLRTAINLIATRPDLWPLPPIAA